MKLCFDDTILFHAQTSGTIICWVFLCWDVLPFPNIRVAFYLMYTICNKDFKNLSLYSGFTLKPPYDTAVEYLALSEEGCEIFGKDIAMK